MSDTVDKLRAEVERCERRLDLARRELRDWLLSHPEDSEPRPSVYETREPMVFHWPAGVWNHEER